MSFASEILSLGRRSALLPRLALSLLVAGAAAPALFGRPAPLTLADALREARAANASLPLPRFDVAIASERAAEARAARWLAVALEGDFVYAPPSGYDPAASNAGEFRLQALARQPLYDGGARRAAVARAEADVDAAAGRYRIAEKDLDLEVSSRFSELLAARDELAARNEGIERLRNYRSLLASRHASGQGVEADRIKAEVRLALEEANVVEAEKRGEDARLELNTLLGRPAAAPLEPFPPADEVPAPPPAPAEEISDSTPEVREARAQASAARADLATARAESKPHLALVVDAGFWGTDTSRLVPAELRAADPDASFGDRVRRDLGYSLGVSLSWPLFDLGGIRARVAQARIAVRRSDQAVEARRRESRLEWEKAEAAIRTLSREIEILRRAAPDARDSYLATESRYRGGAASTLEVLDAYAAAVDASVRLSEAVSRYRIARAVETRWGTP